MILGVQFGGRFTGAFGTIGALLLPLGINGQVAVNHVAGRKGRAFAVRLGVPAGEGIAAAGGVGGEGDSGTALRPDSLGSGTVRKSAAVGVEGDGQ